jgi:hypothetical protein
MLIPTGFAQANLRFSGAAAPTGAEVTMGLDLDSWAGTIVEAAEAVLEQWTTDVMPGLSENLTLSSCLVKYGPNDLGPSAEVSSTATGDVTGENEVPQCAILVRKITAIGGRAGRGRWFVPGASENLFLANGEMNPGDSVIYDGFFEDFRSGISAAGLSLVLLHSDTSPVTTPTEILSLSTDGKAATQRRRLRR